MAMEILHRYAEDKNGNIIHITNAEAGKKYFCSGCKEEFIFRNGKIRQKHFSHKNKTQVCGGGGEGYLHETFKKMLFYKIVKNINEMEPLVINWKCNICNNGHFLDLLLGIKEIRIEYNLEGCRPDLVLFNEMGQVPFIIEIVDTHEPENNVIEYCKRNNTILIIIKLKDLNDLDNIDNIMKNPSNVILFNKTQCPIFVRNIQQKAQILYQITPKKRTSQRGALIDRIDVVQGRRKTSRKYGKKCPGR
jgi:hypothetical protein